MKLACLRGKHQFITPDRLPGGSLATWDHTTRAICPHCGKVRISGIRSRFERYEDWELTDEYRSALIRGVA